MFCFFCKRNNTHTSRKGINVMSKCDEQVKHILYFTTTVKVAVYIYDGDGGDDHGCSVGDTW